MVVDERTNERTSNDLRSIRRIWIFIYFTVVDVVVVVVVAVVCGGLGVYASNNIVASWTSTRIDFECVSIAHCVCVCIHFNTPSRPTQNDDRHDRVSFSDFFRFENIISSPRLSRRAIIIIIAVVVVIVAVCVVYIHFHECNNSIQLTLSGSLMGMMWLGVCASRNIHWRFVCNSRFHRQCGVAVHCREWVKETNDTKT